MAQFKALRKLTHVQIVTTVLALTWAGCPFVFAAERAKQLVRDTLIRQFEDAGDRALFDQISRIAFSTSAVAMAPSTVELPASLTVERPEGTYVITNLDVVNTVVSGTVTVFDADGLEVGTVDIAQATLSDDNRIDYAVTTTTADESRSEVGSLTGITEEEGTAIQLVSINGEDTNINVVNYKALLEDGGTTSSHSCPVTTSSYGGGTASDGSVAIDPCTALAVVVVIIVFVIVCYLFCWML